MEISAVFSQLPDHPEGPCACWSGAGWGRKRYDTLYDKLRQEDSEASGDAFSFSDCAAINIKNGSNEVSQTGIISFIHDIENVAAYFGDRKSWEMVNPRSDVVIHGEKAQKGFAVDNHANAVVFYLAAAGTASLAEISHGSATLSSTAAYRGQTITVTASPSSGYHVKSVKVGDVDLVKVSDTVYNWKCLSDSNVEIAVTMEANA